MRRRLGLDNFRGMLVAPDMGRALSDLAVRASAAGWRVDVAAPPPAPWDPRSMAPAGREVRLAAWPGRGRPDPGPAARLAKLWTLAVPVGLTPWLRFPVPGPGDDAFHCMGPWQAVVDRLLAAGRGELAWESACAAAQADVGAWRGDAPVERLIQAQLHRLGLDCGPVDGIVGPRTRAAIQSVGVRQDDDGALADALCVASPPQPPAACPVARGLVSIPGRRVVVTALGPAVAERTPTGAVLEIQGAEARIVVDVGGLDG